MATKLSDVIQKMNTPEASVTEPKGALSKLVEYANSSAPDAGGNTVSGYNSEIGNSTFDDTYLNNVYKDLEDFRSKEQHWAAKTAAGLGRVVNKVGVELAKIPGYIGGGVMALGAEEGKGMDTFVNNKWIKAIEGYEENINENVLPVYTKEAVRNGDIWSNISSVDFWAQEGADGLGFMLSMLVPGAALAKVGAGTKLMSLLGKGGTAGKNMINVVDKASKALGMADGAAAIDLTLGTAVNTMFEAGSEANGVMKNMTRNDGETDNEFERRKAEAARNVFVSNLGILLVPNMILNRSVFGRLSPDKQLDNFAVNAGKITNKLKDKPLKQRIAEYGKIIPSNVLREGFFEEGSQSAVENYFKDNNNFDADGILKSYMETIQSVDGQKAILLGGLFGSISGIVGKVRQDKSNEERVSNLTNVMNEGIDIYEKSLTGIYKKDGKGDYILDENGNPQADLGSLSDVAHAQAYLQKQNEAYDAAVRAGDNETASLLRNQMESELALSFIKAGDEGITLLRQKLEDSRDMVAQQEGIDPANESEVNAKISDIIANAKNLQKENNFFTNYGINISPSTENAQYFDDFRSRLQNMYLKTSSNLKYLSKRKKELETLKSSFLASMAEELDATPEELTTNPNIKQLDKVIKDLDEIRNDLKDTYKNLTNKKYQQSQFSDFIKSREEMADVEEILKEDKKQTEELSNAIDEEVKADDKQVETTKEEEITIEAKKETNNAYDKLEKALGQVKEDDKSGKNKSTEKFFGEKGAEVNKAGTATFKDGMVRYPLGVQDPAILEVFPELKGASTATIFQEKDKEGNNTYRVVAFGEGGEKLAIPTLAKYEMETREVPSVSTTEVVDDNITNLDENFENQTNKNIAREIEASSVTVNTGEKSDINGKNNKVVVGRKHVKLVESSDTLITSSLYKEFRESPRDKTNEKVSFRLGNPGTNKSAENALQLANRILNESFKPTKDQRQELIDYLPIMVTFNEGVYTHMFLGNDQNKNSNLSTKETQLKGQIVDAIISGKDINDLKGKIKFQFPGWVQNDVLQDGSPAFNSVLELYGIDNNVDNVDLLYSTGSGELYNTLKEPSKDFIGFNVKEKNKGSLFLKTKGANGKNIPLKLNIRRVNENEADLLLTFTEKLIDPEYTINYKDRLNLHPELVESTKELYMDDITALNKTLDNVTVGEVFSSIVYEGTGIKNWFKISGDTLRVGEDKVKYEDFDKKREEIRQWLLTWKNRNIQVSKLSEQSYKKHMLESRTISTDIKIGGPIFQGNTGIYIDSILDSETLPEIKTPKVTKSNKTKGRKKKSNIGAWNKINKINNKGEDSNTIC